MTFQEYHLETRRTLPDLDKVYLCQEVVVVGYSNKYPELIRVSSLPEDLLEITHMILGMLSEIKELSEAVDKGDIVNIAEELVDILWYSSNYALLRKIDISGYQFPGFGISGVTDIAIAISGLSDYTKKLLAYKRPIEGERREEEVKCFFEVLDACGEFANLYKIDIYSACEKNINKLRVRFPDKFSTTLAQEENRNLIEERKTLE